MALSPLAPLPPPKIFKPKFDLPLLDNYRDNAPPSYWEAFPKNLVWPAKALIDHSALRRLATECGFKDSSLLENICNDLKFGADIGCRGPYRLPSKATNAPSAYENGEKVSDSIADWCQKGFVYGPVPDDRVPSVAKFSGIMTRAKPNGSVRIILNLSSPCGNAVNEGIDSDEFPATMSSTTKWLTALWAAGKNCFIMKEVDVDLYRRQ